MARNKIGFHLGVPSRATGYGDYVRALDARGIPAVCMSVGGGGLGDIIAQWERGSTVDHVAVVRYMPPEGHPDGHQDVPRYDMTPAAAAVRFWEWTRPLIGADVRAWRHKIWVKIGNELDKNQAEWLARFYTAMYSLMQADPGGPFKLVAFSWAAGEPQVEQWNGPAMRAFLRLAAAHPGDIAIGLHEYSYADTLQEDYPFQIGRFQALFEVCDLHNIPRPPVFIHEFGWHQDTMPGPVAALEQLQWAAALYARYPQVRGAGLWTLQSGGTYGNPHISHLAQPLIAPITEYTMSTTFPDPTPAPAPPRHKAVVVKLPQDCSLDEWLAAAEAAYQFRHTQTASHDDTRTLLLGGSAESLVKFTHPERDAVAVRMVEELGYRWEPFYTGAPVPPAVEMIDIVDELPRHATKRYAERELSAITHLTIHHTVSPPDRSIESIAAYHVDKNGWPGIGYHFVVRADGRVYLTNYLTTKSYHAGSITAPGDENLYSVGIALQGDFTSAPPPTAQLDAARALVETLRGQLVNLTAVLGHREMPGASTACPGATWQSWLPYVAGTETAPAPAPEPPPPPPPPPPAGASVNFAACLLPANGAAVGPWQVFEKSGGGTVDQQTQVHGEIVYRVKSGPAGTTEYEELRVRGGMIQRRYDTSPGAGLAYKLDDGNGWSDWMPAVMREGEVYRRAPRVTWYDLSNGCALVKDDGYRVSYLRFARLHSSLALAGGLTLANVAELHWCHTPDGPWAERYFVAAGRWYVKWENFQGASHVMADEPQGRPPLPLRLVPCLG